MHKRNSLYPGFTIVELLVVIVVIGILAAVTIVSYTGISQKATIASLQSDLSASARRLKMYYTDNGTYPQSLDPNNCPVGPADLHYCLKPSINNSYTYCSESPYNTFSLKSSTITGTTYRLTESSAPQVSSPGVIIFTTGGAISENCSGGGTRTHTFSSDDTITATASGTITVTINGAGGGGGICGDFSSGCNGGGTGVTGGSTSLTIGASSYVAGGGSGGTPADTDGQFYCISGSAGSPGGTSGTGNMAGFTLSDDGGSSGGGGDSGSCSSGGGGNGGRLSGNISINSGQTLAIAIGTGGVNGSGDASGSDGVITISYPN